MNIEREFVKLEDMLCRAGPCWNRLWLRKEAVFHYIRIKTGKTYSSSDQDCLLRNTRYAPYGETVKVNGKSLALWSTRPLCKYERKEARYILMDYPLYKA